MNTFFKWFSLVTCVLSVPFIILLVYVGEWLDIITWAFLGVTCYFNYQTAVAIEEQIDHRN